MKKVLLGAVALFAMLNQASAQSVTITPGPGALSLTPASNASPAANATLGSVGCIAASGTICNGQVFLLGPNATSFGLTNGGKFPTNLTVGPQALANGTYNVIVHRNNLGVPFTITVTGGNGGPPPPPGQCPDDDGSVGASSGTPNYPTLISAVGYKASINGAKGLGCKVPGVDYVVGTPPNISLKDPTTVAIPSCKYDGSRYVDCADGAVVDGFDFGKNNTLLTGNGKITVLNSKFVFGANCTDPVINVAGSLTLSKTTMDGTLGWACNLDQGFGTFVNVDLDPGGAFVATYDHLIKVAQDGFDIASPASGNASTTIKYNAVYREGSTGHPDWLQYCGTGPGVVTPNDIRHNLWYGQPEPGPDEGGTQPIHVEAQICSGAGHVAKTVVAFNTVLGTGKCNGGQTWPIACSMNFGIAPKVDDPTSSNVGFSAYGNYIDWSGGIAALTNGYGVGANATFGTPYPNYDMTSGLALGNNPAVQPRIAAKLTAADVGRQAKIQRQRDLARTLLAEARARLQK